MGLPQDTWEGKESVPYGCCLGRSPAFGWSDSRQPLAGSCLVAEGDKTLCHVDALLWVPELVGAAQPCCGGVSPRGLEVPRHQGSASSVLWAVGAGRSLQELAVNRQHLTQGILGTALGLSWETCCYFKAEVVFMLRVLCCSLCVTSHGDKPLRGTHPGLC